MPDWAKTFVNNVYNSNNFVYFLGWTWTPWSPWCFRSPWWQGTKWCSWSPRTSRTTWHASKWFNSIPLNQFSSVNVCQPIPINLSIDRSFFLMIFVSSFQWTYIPFISIYRSIDLNMFISSFQLIYNHIIMCKQIIIIK